MPLPAVPGAGVEQPTAPIRFPTMASIVNREGEQRGVSDLPDIPSHPVGQPSPQQFGSAGYPTMPGPSAGYPSDFSQPGGYNPQQGSYNPQQGGYNPQQGGYNPQQGGYNPQQGGYNPSPPNPFSTQPFPGTGFSNPPPANPFQGSTGFSAAPAPTGFSGPQQPTGFPHPPPQTTPSALSAASSPDPFPAPSGGFGLSGFSPPPSSGPSISNEFPFPRLPGPQLPTPVYPGPSLVPGDASGLPQADLFPELNLPVPLTPLQPATFPPNPPAVFPPPPAASSSHDDLDDLRARFARINEGS